MKYTFYKIYCKTNPELLYIGSTNKFSSRKAHHKKNVHNKVGKLYHLVLYKTIRNNGKWENFTIEPIETKEFETKQECNYYEQLLITIHKPSLNTNKSTRQSINDLDIKTIIELQKNNQCI